MIGALWNLVICSVVLLGLSRVMDGVRCKRFTDALLTSALYTVLYAILIRVFVILSIGPAVLTAALVPVLGALAVGVGYMVMAFVIAAVSLYVADQIVPGFEIADFPTTMLVAFLVGLCNLVLASFGLMV